MRKTIFKTALAWLPFFASWLLFRLAYSETTLTAALRSAGVATVIAAVLGFGVWWMTGRVPWPERIRPTFYVLHLVAALAFTAAWTLLGYIVAAIEMGHSLGDLIRNSQVLSWRLLMGLWLYGLVAGISYAVRTRTRLRDQERLAARAQALATTARLEGLRARLNPHFLFNALHSVSALIRHDSDKAERAIEQLGDMLRYSLGDDGADEVTLEAEWRFTHEYLALQELRFGPRLTHDTHFADGTMACRVPSFVLQPLVENAVQHNIDRNSSGLHVVVGASLNAGKLTLSVEDNGMGADRSDGLLASGHGLHTLQERLRALYGDGVSLDLSSPPDGGFCARVVIPQSGAGRK